MSLTEKHVIVEVEKLTTEQLLDVKINGKSSETFQALERETGCWSYRTFALEQVENRLTSLEDKKKNTAVGRLLCYFGYHRLEVLDDYNYHRCKRCNRWWQPRRVKKNAAVT